MLKTKAIKKVCDGVIRMIAFQQGYVIHEMQVLDDHIHLFIELPPSVSISKAFQMLKGISSRVLRRNFRWLRKFKCLWSKGKFYRSVGNVTAGVIEHYIQHSQGNYDYFNTRRSYISAEQMTITSF
jgi:putative transposase